MLLLPVKSSNGRVACLLVEPCTLLLLLVKSAVLLKALILEACLLLDSLLWHGCADSTHRAIPHVLDRARWQLARLLLHPVPCSFHA